MERPIAPPPPSVTTNADMQSNSTSGRHAAEHQRLRIGLTGGIASGKTTASQRLGELGAGIIDTDAIAHDIVAPGTPGLNQVVEALGPEVLDDAGSLDRATLRERIFSDSEAKAQLEAVLHPLIRSQALKLAENMPGDYLVFVVPLLFETDFGTLVDRVLVVDCPVEIQQQRLMQRDNETTKSADRAIASQIDRASRVELADDVINNSGSLEELLAAVDEIHQRYLEQAQTESRRPD
jgi:dephospho-CoA kinase